MTLIELQLAIAYCNAPGQSVKAEDSPKWGLDNKSETWTTLEKMAGRGLLIRTGYQGTWDHYRASENLMQRLRELMRHEF